MSEDSAHDAVDEAWYQLLLKFVRYLWEWLTNLV